LSASPPFWDSENDEDPVVLEIMSEERQKLPPAMFLDFGPPLPGHYGVDQLQLMLQSPLRVFAYWELSDVLIDAALRHIPMPDRQNCQLLLRWTETDAGRVLGLDVGTATGWWFDTLPERCYRLELGLYWGEHGWLPLLSSNELATPRLGLGPPPAEEPAQAQALLADLVRETGIELLPAAHTLLPPIEVKQQPVSESAAVLAELARAIEWTAEQAVLPTYPVSSESSRPTSGWRPDPDLASEGIAVSPATVPTQA